MTSPGPLLGLGYATVSVNFGAIDAVLTGGESLELVVTRTVRHDPRRVAGARLDGRAEPIHVRPDLSGSTATPPL